jgi:hypothetical protein
MSIVTRPPTHTTTAPPRPDTQPPCAGRHPRTLTPCRANTGCSRQHLAHGFCERATLPQATSTPRCPLSTARRQRQPPPTAAAADGTGHTHARTRLTGIRGSRGAQQFGQLCWTLVCSPAVDLCQPDTPLINIRKARIPMCLFVQGVFFGLLLKPFHRKLRGGAVFVPELVERWGPAPPECCLLAGGQGLSSDLCAVSCGL